MKVLEFKLLINFYNYAIKKLAISTSFLDIPESNLVQIHIASTPSDSESPTCAMFGKKRISTRDRDMKVKTGKSVIEAIKFCG